MLFVSPLPQAFAAAQERSFFSSYFPFNLFAGVHIYSFFRSFLSFDIPTLFYPFT
ncbi:hypothetical protein D9611_008740 [Ephemerocybe angulata]|uniref:Uncharacterized protein n=1 Tax=Ephemerocybe angulata TaxID=980116 RepID=A0A8H5FJJ0_9AGAR|nr:hypothetical protein D9611_008740 [Tulosesus angulatus]